MSSEEIGQQYLEDSKARPGSLGQNPFYSLEQNPPTRARRPQNSLSDFQIKAFLHRSIVGHFGTRWNEQPFITPSNFWFDESKHQILFHSNVVGRIRANSERHDQICMEASEFGNFLPSNDPLEVSIQYRSVMVFGKIVLLEGEDAREALYGLMHKYLPAMTAGVEYRKITDADLKRTSVYAIQIEHWSGKENWQPKADQTDEHPALDERWFSFTNFLDWQKNW
jgi:uncharacterized protein